VLRSLGRGATLAPMGKPTEVKTEKLVAEGILKAHRRIAALLKNQGLSAKTLAYLQDPSKTPASETANVRAELADFFEEHPEVARQVAREITMMRDELAATRKKLPENQKWVQIPLCIGAPDTSVA